MKTLELIDQLFLNRETKIARDLKINLKNIVSKSSLPTADAGLELVALSKTTEFSALKEIGLELLRESGEEFSAEQLQEAEESAAMMGMLNVYYRFRHFLNDSPDYKVAGLRMQALATPALGQERFELLALAHSIVNGCEKCVSSHELSLTNLGTSKEKIHDVARLAAICNGLKFLS